MGADEIRNAGRQLFARINTNHEKVKGSAEKLDAKEVIQANAFGFKSLFNITEGMTEEKFVNEYANIKLANAQEEDAFVQKERNIHEQYIKLKYGIQDIKMQDGESVEQFEARVKQTAVDQKIEEEIDRVVKEFGLDSIPESEEGYIEPDPTMCRDSKTHDW